MTAHYRTFVATTSVSMLGWSKAEQLDVWRKALAWMNAKCKQDTGVASEVNVYLSPQLPTLPPIDLSSVPPTILQ